MTTGGGATPGQPVNKLTTLGLAAYALPAIALATLTLPVYIYVPSFYADGLGLSLAAVGQILLLIRLADAVTDPLAGYFSDRIGIGRFRRKPWFAASLPVIALGLLFLLIPPEGAGLGHLALWGLVLSIGWTLALIPYAAWGAELSPDYHERSRIVGAREACVVFGTLLATALPAILLAFGETDQARVMAVLAWTSAPLLVATGVLALIMAPEPQNRSLVAPLPLRTALGHMVRNRPFVRLVAAFLINGLANGLPATLFLLFAAYRLDAEDWAGLFLFAYFLSGVVGIPVWLAVSRHVGKHRTWCYAMLFACVFFAAVPVLGPGAIIPFLVISVATGFALGADLVLPNAMQADVIDLDLAASGEQRSGAYFAAWSVATKLALALAVGIAFPVLAMMGFDPGTDIVTDTGLPATLFLLFAAYRLDAEDWAGLFL
ncbi:MAG: MFS transporter, partial [Pseudomonadota bacterium]